VPRGITSRPTTRGSAPNQHTNHSTACVQCQSVDSAAHLEDHAHMAAVRATVVEAIQQPHAGGRALRGCVRPPRDRRQQIDLITRGFRVVVRALLHLLP